MTVAFPDRFNISDYFLDARLADGLGSEPAIITDGGTLTYQEVRDLANRFGNLLKGFGVEPEQRVIVAVPDGFEFVGALFGALKIGAVAVMVNPFLRREEIAYFYRYTRAKVAVVAAEQADGFLDAAEGIPTLENVLVLGDSQLDHALSEASSALENFPTHRDDPAMWLFSGGTTGKPKAVVQTHRSFANTTECYAKGVLGLGPDDRTISVPKLFFGYATGSNLLFPFAVGGSTVLFPDRCTPEILFSQIQKHRPTILVNVPTMVNQMVTHPEAKDADLGSLRLSTSAGEALPEELHRKWDDTFGVELLDGLGTAEMWHIFISNRPGRVRRGTVGEVVPGFDVRLCDEAGRPVEDGEVGNLWVRGGSRAIAYWQEQEKTEQAFRGEWYVSGDLLSRDSDGYYRYAGRADDMLKVAGKWLSPQEVENCLLQHPRVSEVAVVGATDGDGLTRTHAFVVCNGEIERCEDVLREHVQSRLASYKVPKTVHALDALPRTHLGKVDRGKLRSQVED